MFKVMIVDDEPIICNGLANFIDWNSIDCEILHEAENGIEATELIKEAKPDIIISDIKMPGMDGLELSKFVYENYPQIKVIILTGYADFSYAQIAIKYGVIDFVLKPAFTERIIEAVSKAKRILIEETEKENKLQLLENKVDNNLDEMKEKFIRDIISEVLIDPKQIKQRMEVLDIKIDRYFVLAFQVETFVNEQKKDQDNFMHSMKNFISLAFKNYRHHNTFMNKNLMCTVLTFDNSREADCIQAIIERCEEILDIVNNFMKFSISIGISNMYIGMDKITSAYCEACDALIGKFYNESNIFIFSNNRSNEFHSNINETNIYLNKIMAYIQSGQCDEAISVMKELMEKEKATKQTVDHVTAVGINICSSCSKLLSNFNLNISDIVKSGDAVYKEIMQCKSISQLEEILLDVISCTSNSISSSKRMNNYIVVKAMEYIKAHYTQNIKSNMIAEYVHVNSSYLSRLFKKETGETITEVINKLRVEKAKELFDNKSIKTYEVALQVGIDDSTYFSQVFKKYTGLSPTEYRYSN